MSPPSLVGSPSQEPIRIAIVGETGSGKSTFINSVIGQDVAPVGHDIATCTDQVTRYSYWCPDGQEVILFDSPGLDGHVVTLLSEPSKQYPSNARILQMLGENLRTQAPEARFSYVFLLHNHSRNEISLQRKEKRLFFKLCGDDRGAIRVITTCWDDIVDGDLEAVTSIEETLSNPSDPDSMKNVVLAQQDVAYLRTGKALECRHIQGYLHPRQIIHQLLGVIDAPPQPSGNGLPVQVESDSNEATISASPTAAVEDPLPNKVDSDEKEVMSDGQTAAITGSGMESQRQNDTARLGGTEETGSVESPVGKTLPSSSAKQRIPRRPLNSPAAPSYQPAAPVHDDDHEQGQVFDTRPPPHDPQFTESSGANGNSIPPNSPAPSFQAAAPAHDDNHGQGQGSDTRPPPHDPLLAKSSGAGGSSVFPSSPAPSFHLAASAHNDDHVLEQELDTRLPGEGVDSQPLEEGLDMQPPPHDPHLAESSGASGGSVSPSSPAPAHSDNHGQRQGLDMRPHDPHLAESSGASGGSTPVKSRPIAPSIQSAPPVRDDGQEQGFDLGPSPQQGQELERQLALQHPLAESSDATGGSVPPSSPAPPVHPAPPAEDVGNGQGQRPGNQPFPPKVQATGPSGASGGPPPINTDQEASVRPKRTFWQKVKAFFCCG